MNEVDVAIILIVAISIYHGTIKGVVTGLLDLIAIPLALAAGAFGWRIPVGIFRAFGFPAPIAGLISFVTVATLVAIGVIYLGLWLFSEQKIPKWLDRGGGGAAGLFTGLIISALLTIISGILPAPRTAMQQSAFGIPIANLVPQSYTTMEKAGIVLPKLVTLPTSYLDELKGTRQGLQFLQINFSSLDGVTCMNCRTPVQFLGYKFKRGTLISPKFECPNCGRTSDGCQTFEGFHRIYNDCPVNIANQDIQFNCGVWTNKTFIVPTGRCPIDGNEYHERKGGS